MGLYGDNLKAAAIRGISIIIYVCNYIRWESSASIAWLVFISIMVSIKGENPVAYSIDEIANTFIGIIISPLVNNVLFRTNFIPEVEVACHHITSTILNLVKKIGISCYSYNFIRDLFSLYACTNSNNIPQVFLPSSMKIYDINVI